MSNTTAYRPDIDGLRALAVVCVVAFHAGVPGFTGGFVGVDVFFVISGYLIARNIYADLAAGTFTLAGFYERRIRRIQPALIAMVLVVMLACAVFLTPVDFKTFAQSVGASLTFSSNLFFFFKSGYFGPGADTQPLLHTWSLAVEEQHYLLFPLLAAAVYRRKPSALTWALALLAAASFAVSVVQVRWQPDAAFYLPFARAWELLLGALLARGALAPPARAWVREACGLVGLLAIVGPVLWLTPASRFPGEAALLPCLGTALLIHAGSGGRSTATALLSGAPFVFIGRISYSLYLWHWPLLVAARYLMFRELQGVEVLGYALAAVALAWASWRWVEQPFRRPAPARLPTRRSVFGATAAVTLAGVAFAAGTHAATGFPGRFDEPSRSYAAAALDTNPQRAACDRPTPERIAGGRACSLGGLGNVGVGDPSFALIGDSFGDAVAPGIAAAALHLGRRGVSLTHSGCFPLLGAQQANPDCARFMDAAVAYVVANPSIRDVVLVGRWTSAVLGDRFGQGQAHAQAQGWWTADALSTEHSAAENGRVFERSFERLLAALADRRVVVVAHVPEQRFDIPRALALSARFGHPAQPALASAEHAARQAAVRESFARLRLHHDFALVDAGAAVCAAAVCEVLRSGVTLYADDNHLSRHGALALEPLWRSALAGAEVPPPQVLAGADSPGAARP